MYALHAYYLLILCLFASACSKLPPLDDGTVSCTISNRIGSDVKWKQCDCQNEWIDELIDCAISNELSADTAIQIALLNNPKIQAIFEDLGIARADLVEAGLLSNPSFEIEVRYPHSKGLKTNIEYLITSSLLDIFLIPLRTSLARLEFEQTKLRVSHAILELAFEVRKTYYELVAEKKNLQYIQSVVELTRIISEISAKQFAVGNVNALELQLPQARLVDAELQLSQSQAEMIRLSEKMHRLLGFTNDICFILPDNLPEIDYYGFDLCTLESIALQERLDVQVARFEIARISQMLGLKNWWTFTNFRVGLSGERDTDGANLIGPGFSGNLPIFNYGQADRMRLYALLRQANDRLAELEIKVLSEVREAHQLLMSYLNIINQYHDNVLPLQSKISTSSEALYNVMGLGVGKLLENKQQEIVATQKYTENLKKYMIARVDLDQALGGYLFKLLAQAECISEVPQ